VSSAIGATEVVRAPLAWREATVTDIVEETDRARTLILDVSGWPGHAAGQHVDVRLTAEDGYQAQRSYSIASPPEDPRLALTIERLDDGEVSPYLAGDVVVGDAFELRGPIGGHFTWRNGDGGPLLLIAGGSGLVPLMAMLRHHVAQRSATDARLLLSARRWEAVLYRDELAHLTRTTRLGIHCTLTREQPRGWSGFSRRVDAEMLDAIGPPTTPAVRAYVCGSTSFVERVADLLVERGLPSTAIHTERFGPTGG
jgi:ferredoxin-NADP reductase